MHQNNVTNVTVQYLVESLCLKDNSREQKTY